MSARAKAVVLFAQLFDPRREQRYAEDIPDLIDALIEAVREPRREPPLELDPLRELDTDDAMQALSSAYARKMAREDK